MAAAAALTTPIDAVLFLFFLAIALSGPLIDSQIVFPAEYYPEFLVEINGWYVSEHGDYLSVEKPAFFVGLIWLELLFQWPVAVANLYGIVASKPWRRTTCLISGVSTLTATTAIISEIMSSDKASDKLLMMYAPFVGFGVLAVLRGLLPCSNANKATTDHSRKKKA